MITTDPSHPDDRLAPAGDGHPVSSRPSGSEGPEPPRTDQAARPSADPMRVVWESALDGMRLTDEGGRVVRVNEAYCRLMQKPRADLEGQPMSVAYLEAHRERIKQKHDELFRSHHVRPHFETQVWLWNGQALHLELSNAFLDLPGEPPLLLSVFRDITERKRAEQALRESERKYRELVENANSIILRWNPQGEVTFLNEFGQQFFGFREPEILGRNIVGTLVPPTETTGRDLRPLMEQIAANPAAFAQNVNENMLRDGRRVWIAWTNKTVFDAAGRLVEVLSIGTDITERKRAEAEHQKLQAQLTQAQKMESVGRLAGGVAHDFNNMLQAILGNASLALEEIPPGSPLRESLEEIHRSAQRSADLTRQLLAFARKQTIQPKVLDLNDTMAGLLKMLRRLIGEDIHLAWMPGADLWPVKVDPSQVDQVVANLCVNARDAIAGTGQLTLETANVTLDQTYVHTHPECVPGDYVLLAVTDTGHGMDAHTRAHLFEPFFTTKAVGKGTGLGLATVFGIVKQNRGLINVYSEPGQGTTFKIYLPRAKAEAVVAKTRTSGPAGRGTETVLLVEDEEQILTLGRRILEQHGYVVLASSTPQAALALAAAQAETIHLLVTDVVLPGMNGKELLQLLRATHPKLKCLFMSGYTANVIAHHGVLEEGVQFLQKPFTIRTLADKVRELLDGAKP